MRFEGSTDYVATPDLKAVVTITLPGKAPEQARFTPLAVPMQSAQDGHSGHSH